MISPAAFCRRHCLAFILLSAYVAGIACSASRDEGTLLGCRKPAYQPDSQNVFGPARLSESSEERSPINTPTYSSTAVNALQELHAALETLQTDYFALWLGKWTTAIDWTAAVLGTHLSATLSSLSQSLAYTMPGTFDKARKLDVEAQMVENEINKYFSQSVAYYFGEDHFSIRNQAYDDMLWVVLGWLESIQFISRHSDTHYPSREGAAGGTWHALQFIPAFAHRARVFYELAEKGWDWRLCGGGMTWNPRLLPYKNAITNELFISASIAMYLSFPGDSNCSPFLHSSPPSCPDKLSAPSPTYDPIYLANAINGYTWLKGIGMTNAQGLYVDGFHIAGYARNHSKTACDDRNEMVYTYNQGVLLSGLRGLWESTGNVSYLEDGHELVRNVIRATGWDDMPMASPESAKPGLAPAWSGLGAHGLLTELCDPSGTCSQNGQSFKGIFFHHLTAFCTPLPLVPVQRGKTYAAPRVIAALHARSCAEYAPWVAHNARAALRTRDERGRFGSWWGADWNDGIGEGAAGGGRADVVLPEGAVDYRNGDGGGGAWAGERESSGDDGEEVIRIRAMPPRDVHGAGDMNDRGRGRTVETQGSGVAVVRAMWEFLRRYGD